MTVEDSQTTAATIWHGVRPWSPPQLTLTTREITSVSATFVLSSFDLHSEVKSISESFLSSSPPSSDKSTDEDDSDTNDRAPISETLSKGLSVKVNSSPWKRVVIRVDERADDAVVIVYGLLPGRGYEIELGVVHGSAEGNGVGLDGFGAEGFGREERIRRDVVTEGSDYEITKVDSRTEGTDGTQTSTDLFPPSEPPSPSLRPTNNTPSPPRPALTLEQRTNYLLQQLSVLNSERNNLLATLKSTRKDTQKADSSLRSEIDILKRSSERFVKEEARTKQKLLALQEAVKRSVGATKEIDQMVKEVEAEVPELDDMKKQRERECEGAMAKAERIRGEREEVEAEGGRREESLKGELGREEARLDRLGGRRERLEGGVSELEEKLEEVRKDIDRAEMEEYRLDEEGERIDFSDERFSGTHENHVAPGQMVPQQRKRHSHHMHPRASVFGKVQHQYTAPGPIQRPAQQPTSPTHHHHHQHNNQSGAHHSSRASVNLAKSQAHVRIATGSSSSGSSNSSPHISSAATTSLPTTASTVTSILSSRATPFEPSRIAQRASSFPPPSPVNGSAQGHVQTQSLSQFGGSLGVMSELNPASAPFTPRLAHLVRAAAEVDGNSGTGTGAN